MPNNKKHCRIVIIEPSPVITTGLKEIIKNYREFEVIATYTHWDYSSNFFQHLSPDVVLVNPSVIDFKYQNDPEKLLSPDINIIFVALVYQYIDPEILKHYSIIIDISDTPDKIYKKLSQCCLNCENRTELSDSNDLSEREKEILISVAKGMLNKEIAEEHHISIHTVITHRKNITRKTGIKSVAGLTVYALLNNLIEMKEVE